MGDGIRRNLEACWENKILTGKQQAFTLPVKEECRTLLDNCKGHLKSIITFAMNTGCRRGEILSLRWDNVDLLYGFIRLDKTENRERRDSDQ
jgi:integrase